jgi:membrane protein required for colicin V production
LPFAAGDIAVVIIVAVSALLAMARGFVAEVLAVAGWVGAALVTFAFFAEARPIAQEYISSPLMADAAAAGVIFLAALVVFGAIAHLLARMVQGSPLGAIDRVLGLAFGAVRGAVLVAIAYLVLIWLFPADNRPVWLTRARLLPYVQQTSDLLVSLVPDDVFARAADSLPDAAGTGAPLTIQDLLGGPPGNAPGNAPGSAPTPPSEPQPEAAPAAPPAAVPVPGGPATGAPLPNADVPGGG